MEELAGCLNMQVYCRVPVAEIGPHEVINLQKFVAGWWRKR